MTTDPLSIRHIYTGHVELTSSCYGTPRALTPAAARQARALDMYFTRCRVLKLKKTNNPLPGTLKSNCPESLLPHTQV